jgi:hypothetical protein
MRTGQHLSLAERPSTGVTNLPRGHRNLHPVATRIIRELDQTDLLQLYRMHHPIAMHVVVAFTRQMLAPKIVGPTYRTTADGRTSEARPQSLMEREDTALGQPVAVVV